MYLGDYAEDYATLNHRFTTRALTGIPTVLVGGVISVHKGSAIGTEKTSAEAYITLDPDFDGITGLNNVLIDLSGDAFFAVGEDYSIVITTGTVDGVSVVGETIATFSIENRYERGTDSASTHNAAAVWTAGSRELSTPGDYKATGFSTHAAADVWSVGSRTLTSFGTLVADTAAAVWAIATSTLTGVGTIGKLLVDNINATISSRSSHNAAAVWSAGSRELSTPAAYKATGFSTHDAAAVKTALEANGSKLDHIWEMTEDDAGTRRLTENALEEAPSSTGLDAAATRAALGMASANLDTQLGDIPTVAEMNARTLAAAGYATSTVCTEARLAELDAANLPADVAGIEGAIGPGADSVTITLTVASVAVADADIWITSDAAGAVVIAGTSQTDSNGQATFLLDAGTTYYFWAQKDGYNLPQGEAFVSVED